MKILVLYHQENGKSGEQLAKIAEATPENYHLESQDYCTSRRKWADSELFDFILFLGDQSTEKYVDLHLALIKEDRHVYSPLIRLGPADPEIMELALSKGFDDYLPLDMVYRLPFLLNRWQSPAKTLPNALYKLIYRDASEAIIIIDLKSTELTAINAKALEVLEEEDDPVAQREKLTTYLSQEELQKKPLRIKELTLGETLSDYRTLITRKGKKKKVFYTTRLIPGQRGIIIFRDVSQQFEAQKNIRQQTNIISLSEKMVGLGSSMYDVSTGKTIWSDNMFELLELSPLEVRPSPQAYFNRVHPEDLEEVKSRFERVLEGQSSKRLFTKHRIITPEGRIKIFAISVLIEYNNGQPHFIYTAHQDITQREKELNQIQESKLVLEQAGRISGLGVARWNTSTNNVHWSAGIYDILDLPKNSIEPSLENGARFLSEEGRSIFWEEAKKLSHNPGMEAEYVSPLFIPKKQKTIKVWAKSILEGGELVVYVVMQDISENYQYQRRIKELNQQLERALDEKEQELEKAMFRLKKIFDNNIIGIAVLDHEYRFVQVNHYLTNILEYRRPEMLGISGLSIIHEEDEPRCREDINRLEEGLIDQCTSQKRLVTKHGKVLWGKLHIGKIRNKSKEKDMAILIIENISTEKELEKERLKAIQQLRESEEKYRQLTEYSADLITIHSPEGIYQFVSGSCKQLLGYEKEELIGKNPYDFFHPADVDKIKNESHLPLLNKKFAQVSTTYRFRKKNGAYIWLNSRTKGILGEDKRIKALHVYSSDITKIVEAEKKTKEALLKEREINELRSQFVTTASHQFRTPLASIKASAQYLKMMIHNPEYKEVFDTIDNETNRLTNLMNDILNLGKIDARRMTLRKKKLDLYPVLQKAVDQHLRSEDDDRFVLIEVKGASRLLHLDANLIENAVGNLISNALKYSKNAAPPLITLTYKKDQAVVEVKDFGRGIPKTDQPHLFTSFFRAKNVQDIEGTGLGLVIARQFIELNGGALSFKSTQNKGTTFWITFPQ